MSVSVHRCSIVNSHGHVLLDKYGRPKERVTDFRTSVSGIRPKNLREGTHMLYVNNTYANVCAYAHTGMYTHTYVHTSVCMYISYLRKYVCTFVRMYVCIMFIYVYTYVHAYVYVHTYVCSVCVNNSMCV